MKHSEQLSQIADILDDLYSVNGEYVSFNFILHSDRTGVTFNIYTPTIKHNSFNNFDQFKEFLLSIKSRGEHSIRRKVLHKNLDAELKRKKDAEIAIKEINRELSSLEVSND